MNFFVILTTKQFQQHFMVNVFLIHLQLLLVHNDWLKQTLQPYNLLRYLGLTHGL